MPDSRDTATEFTDRLLADATDFFLAHRAMRGEVYSDEEREGVGRYILTTLAFLTVQANHLGIEDDLNRVLVQIAQGDRR